VILKEAEWKGLAHEIRSSYLCDTRLPMRKYWMHFPIFHIRNGREVEVSETTRPSHTFLLHTQPFNRYSNMAPHSDLDALLKRGPTDAVVTEALNDLRYKVLVDGIPSGGDGMVINVFECPVNANTSSLISESTSG